MASIDISQIIETTAPAVPQIYAYTTPEIVRHNGWTKIGYTEQDVRERIKQQTHTADVQWHLEWSGNATWEHRAGTFHDTDFHAYLEKQGVEREPKKEWFKISGEESHQQFYRFRDTDGVLDAPGAASYTLRAEQQRAVEQTGAFARAHWDEGGAHGGEFLWNAKPRFGKTLTAYDLCRSIGAQKVLIVTNRPAIANSWYDDYVKFVGLEGGYRFISGVDALTGKPYCLSREEYLRAIRNDPEGPKGFIEFVSLQDLKGSIRFGGVYQKLDEVADLTWDVLIIDEAHEGVDTFKTDVAFDHIKRRFTLHLSGTPFKAIANEKFADDAIYNWTYADEQQAKRDWPADSEQPNPYANLPKLNLLTYQMSDIVEQEARGGMEIDGEQTEFAFDLNEFFLTKHNGGFVHDADVDKFLDALTTQEKFPFSTPGLRDELRHTFWMLNRVDSARALAKKLQAHPVFKDYEVVLAAGDGKIDADDENEKSLDKVRRAIKDHDRTITLSVGQLTTGVTVPEWTAVLMLSNMASPALYMQAAFRSQNPCLFDLGGGNYARKENAYVFDFDPARTLTIFEQFANDLYGETARGGGDVETRERHIRQLLNFFPVYGEDEEGQMVELDAEQVLSVPRRIHAREVVRRGFMSNFLFQNIASVFRAPAEVVEIIQRFDPYEQGKAQNAEKNKVEIYEGTADELSINDEGEVEIPDEQVVGKAADIFGPKVYGDIAVEFSGHMDDIAKAHEADDDDRVMLDNLKEAFKQSVTAPLVQAAKESYGSELKPRQQQQIERKVQADADIQLNRQVGDYQMLRVLYASCPNALARIIRTLQLESDPEMLCSAVDPGDLEYVLDQVGDDYSDIDYVDFSQTFYEAIERSRPSSKLVACERLVERIVTEGRPVIVWCIFVRSISNLRRDLAAMGIPAEAIYGATPQEERREILDDFRAGRFRVLVTNPQTLAESVSLHSVCHDAVYFEYSYNLVHLLQSKDRIHRLGLPDDQKTRYYFMREKFMRDGRELSLDAVIYDRLKEKEQTMLDAIDRGCLEGGYLDDEDLRIVFERLLGEDAKSLEY